MRVTGLAALTALTAVSAPLTAQTAADSAAVRAAALDYLHLARWQGRWMIVNVLWELRPRP